MSLGSLVFLSVGLAMDATAVAATRGVVAERVAWRDVAAVALTFGGFQAAMPLLGWLAGDRLGAYVAAWDHWIAFVLLTAIGGKMLREAGRAGDGGPSGPPPLSLRVLLVLALATSIDALAAGFALPVMGLAPLPAIAAIGATTAALSALGVVFGNRLGSAVGPRLPALGGLVLIALGAKILVEHLSAGT